jgi:hypothetical protein
MTDLGPVSSDEADGNMLSPWQMMREASVFIYADLKAYALASLLPILVICGLSGLSNLIDDNEVWNTIDRILITFVLSAFAVYCHRRFLIE